MDPFAGSGAIPTERAKLPYQKIIAGDIDTKQNWHSLLTSDRLVYRHETQRNRSVNKYGKVELQLMDVLDMKGIEDNSIDKIITDPPWGLYSAIGDIDTFYTKAVREMVRVLKSGGLTVVLVGRNVGIEKILEQFTGKLELNKSYNILVSGKKAGIFVIKKTNLINLIMGPYVKQLGMV